MLSRKTALLICLMLLQGCATLAESRINHALDKQHQQRLEGADHTLTELDFVADNFCLPHRSICTGYLIAEPVFLKGDPAAEQLAVKRYSHTYFRVNVTSPRREQVLLELAPPTQRFNGSWVLLHGFSGDKSVMAFNAFALRSLGFHVVVPDLQGHGAATGPAAVDGQLDAQIVSQLLDKLLVEQRITEPIYLLGHSLGANVATHISARRQDIAGQVLVAPMHDFSSGLQNYVAQMHGLYYRILGAKQLQQITDAALQQRNIAPGDTAIAPVLAKSNTPSLLIASEQDSIAPAHYFHQLQRQNLRLYFPAGRTHIGLGMFNNDEWQLLQRWLTNSQSELVDLRIGAD